MLRVGVIGASGYTGAELLRLSAAHPNYEVVYLTADTQAGQEVGALYPSLAGRYRGRTFTEFNLAELQAANLDLVFLGLPHEASMALAPQLVGDVECVVDLSAAFRLKDASLYPQWYRFDHNQPELLGEAVYGLPERTRTQLKGARLIATPGCYVTAATLALVPLLDAGLIEATGIIVDAASGVSGAGRAASSITHFGTVDENFNAYGLLSHRHTPEIEQNLSVDAQAQVLFTPHLVPMSRGILATCYATPTRGGELSTESLLGVFSEAYADEPFVVVTDQSPATKATLGSNNAVVTVRYDARTNRVLALCAIDNLTKGASGGAIQAANVALGLDETAGLPTVGLMP